MTVLHESPFPIAGASDRAPRLSGNKTGRQQVIRRATIVWCRGSLSVGDKQAVISDSFRTTKSRARRGAILLFLLTFVPVHSQQPPQNQAAFIMLIFVRSPAEAWTMNANATGAVAACHQTGNSPSEKHSECRHGTQAQAAYAQLQSLTSALRSVPGTKGAQASNGGELQVIVSQYGGMRYDRSKVGSDPTLKQLLDLMVQTNRRIGGEEFVPHF